MNAHETTGIRELTAQELDQVTGGEVFIQFFNPYSWLLNPVVGLLDWLFG